MGYKRCFSLFRPHLTLSSLFWLSSELVAARNEKSYWSLIDSIVEDGLSAAEAEQMSYFEGRESFNALNEEGLLSLSLSLRVASPRCELFQQHANNILTHLANINTPSSEQKPITWFALIANAAPPHKRVITDLKDLQDTILLLEQGSIGVIDAQNLETNATDSFSSLLFPFDHRRAGSPTAKYNLIVHASYADSEFAKVHRLLMARGSTAGAVSDLPLETTSKIDTDASLTSNANYILRPFSAAAWHWHLHRDSEESPVSGPLQGYGVEMAIKNVEYRVLDVKSIKAGISNEETSDSQNAQLQTPEPLNIDGDPHFFLKEELSRIHPQRASQLEEVFGKLFVEGDFQASTDSSADQPKRVTDLDAIAIDSLALKALETVYASEDPMRALRDISQNLPTVAPLLAVADLGDAGSEYLERYSAQFEGGQSMLVLNGRTIDIDNLDPFDILSTISEEVDKYKSLQEVGLEASKSVLSALSRKAQLSKSDRNFEQSAGKLVGGFSHAQIQEYLVDSLDTGFSPKIDLFWKDIVTVINDLETDPVYLRWPKRVRDLLKPTWPGQLTPIAKNFYTIVVVLDPSASTEGIRILDQLTRVILGNMIPIRLSYHVVLPNPKGKEEMFKDACASYDATTLEKCNVNWLWAKLLKSIVTSQHDFLTFLQIVSRSTFEPLSIRQAWEHSGVQVSWEDALDANDDFLAKAYTYLSSAGLLPGNEGSNNNIVLLNGKLLNVDPDEPLREIGAHLQLSKQQFQQDIYRGAVSDMTDLYTYSLGDESEVFPGWNMRIFEKSPVLRKLHVPGFDWSLMNYLTVARTGDGLKHVTHLLIADATASATRKAISDYLTACETFTSSLSNSRLAFLPLPGTENTILSKALHYAIETFAKANGGAESNDKNSRDLLDALLALDADSDGSDFCVSDSSAACAGFNAWIKDLDASKVSSTIVQKVQLSASLLARANVLPSEIAKNSILIVSNGRYVELNSDDASMWDESSWMMLTKYEDKLRASGVASLLTTQHSFFYEDAVEGSGIPRPLTDLLWLRGADSDISMFGNVFTANDLIGAAKKAQSDVIALLTSSFASASGKSKKQGAVQLNAATEGAGITVRSKTGDKPLMISGSFFVDPLSPTAQTVSALLLTFMKSVPMEIKLVLMPKAGLSEVPLKSYFRYVFTPSPRFAATGLREVVEERAEFDHLPEDKILTMNVKTPGGWLISTKKAALDLDNILLKPVDLRRVSAEYSLDYLLVEGSCSDLSAGGQPPRGLKIRLGTATNPHVVDTIVMSNLGYYQLKANPGVWDLTLAPGRGSEIYEVQNKRSLHGASMTTYVDALSSDRVLLKVHKRSGMERATLEDDDASKEDEGFWSGIFAKQPKAKAVEDDDTVHVFSVASGHLYERFLRIMMLSVRENTKSKVKFWIIKNFLSPAFVQTIDALGEEFGFEVELVQYQWPEWLRRQTEKQRKIWGYKILFLDVLFPLSLKRVIFIDADQVVRTDLKQLMTIDLHGAPYGFTPFCDGVWTPDQNEKDPEARGMQEFKRGRTDTRGFRFWDSGFWKDHLRGRPYHISALFVVDLDLLRRKGYADQLRATYDQLSRDPGSLANLDQDLPNYLQHAVPIYSLSPEWLWCETWCSDDSKVFAKTIDLCNNPLTKTPKLESALRIIPEWTRLDNASSSFFHTLQDKIIYKQTHPDSEATQSAPQTVSSETSTRTSEDKDEL